VEYRELDVQREEKEGRERDMEDEETRGGYNKVLSFVYILG